jgi:hypothetical protein
MPDPCMYEAIGLKMKSVRNGFGVVRSSARSVYMYPDERDRATRLISLRLPIPNPYSPSPRPKNPSRLRRQSEPVTPEKESTTFAFRKSKVKN